MSDVMLTENEKRVLDLVCHGECNQLNGGDITEETTHQELTTWSSAEEFTPHGLTINQTKGVLSSLVKKELIDIQPYDRGMDTVSVTEKGLSTWRKYFSSYN